jgi:hypothetical protein
MLCGEREPLWIGINGQLEPAIDQGNQRLPKRTVERLWEARKCS